MWDVAAPTAGMEEWRCVCVCVLLLDNTHTHTRMFAISHRYFYSSSSSSAEATSHSSWKHVWLQSVVGTCVIQSAVWINITKLFKIHITLFAIMLLLLLYNCYYNYYYISSHVSNVSQTNIWKVRFDIVYDLIGLIIKSGTASGFKYSHFPRFWKYHLFVFDCNCWKITAFKGVMQRQFNQ